GGGACGKSVLFRVLSGEMLPTTGKVTLLGEDVHRLKGHKGAELLHKVGFAYQGGALLKSLSVLENVALPLLEVERLDWDEAHDRTMKLLSLLGLSQVAELFPHSLSASEVKRTALARALALEPQVVLCDDVFSGLGWRLQDRLFELLLELSDTKNLTVVVFTPAYDVALRFGDRVALLDTGKIIAEGPVEEIKALEDDTIRHILTPTRESFAAKRARDGGQPEGIAP
ncbi:MAG: ATP-binding cassette domain-containing protein, partial [Kiloniellales bacterium]|nr:ATP-binding cassette domain-containing protein [Kiloniellales bacterium]